MKEKLIKLIDSCDVVSFDIFDTLIFRNIYEPTDIFKMVANYAALEYKIEDFFTIRVEAEKESRVQKNNFESNIDEIYNNVLKKIGKKNVVNDLKKKELDLELEFCVVNPFMKDIFLYCKKKNKKVVLISDMYLKKDFILKILNNNGYDKFDLYVSNEVRKNKGTTELYQHVYEKNKFDKEKWIHIGDNTHSDYNMPIKFGIKAFNYKKVSTYAKIKPKSIFESILLGIQCNYLYNGIELDYWETFGVKNISFIYFGFTKWLYDLTKNEENLFFIARDGYIIDKIYDIFNSDKKVFTKYLYCSRNSIQIPSLIDGDKDRMVNYLTQDVLIDNKLSLKEYLEKAQVNVEKIDFDIVKSFGFESLDEIVNEDNKYNAKKLVAKNCNNIKDNLMEKNNLAKLYLDSLGLNKYNKINIMDIGWAGSIQESISLLLKKEVIGYYFGTIDSDKKDAFSNMFGYYFDLDKPLSNKRNVISNVMMYELIFSAPHGTTVGYEKVDDSVQPILSEDIHYNKVVEKFQNAALEIIKVYLQYIKYFDSLDKDFCLLQYKQFLKNKKIDDLREFSKLSNDFILGSSKSFNYVSVINKSDLEKGEKFLVEKVSKSLWPDTFYIDETNNIEKDYLYVNKCVNKVKYLNNSLNFLECAKVYLDNGDGFSEENILFVPYEKIGNSVKFRLTIDETVKRLRIDPCEGQKIKITNLIIDSNNGSVDNISIPHKDYIYGKLNKCICIRSKDPRIILNDATELKWIMFSGMIERI